MSKLNYASVDEAFKLGSDQIKNTQEEIAKLKALIMENNQVGPVGPVGPVKQVEPIGPVSVVPQVQSPPTTQTISESDEILLKRLMDSPRFDSIVKNYISVKHPEYLKETNLKETFGLNKEMNNIFVFLIITIIIYLLCSLIENF